jgi:large subunit ribosomal protein L6
MSNLAKHAIKIPSNVFIKIENNLMLIEGPLGKKTLKLLLKVFLNEKKEIVITNEILQLFINDKTLNAKAIQGSTCALIKQIFLGISVGFRKQLNIVGVGYRASVDTTSLNKILVLKLGYSHPISINIPNHLKIICIKPTLISIFGNDKQEVNQMAAIIKSYKMPEPYKGKGILYQDEKILRKEGKRS